MSHCEDCVQEEIELAVADAKVDYWTEQLALTQTKYDAAVLEQQQAQAAYDECILVNCPPASSSSSSGQQSSSSSSS